MPHDTMTSIGAAAPAAGWRAGLIEFIVFGLKQARACLFPGLFFVILALSHLVPADGALGRYDFIFLATLAVQAVLLALRVETLDEVKTLSLFHLLGLGLELFKTHPAVGSWSYPEPAFFKIGGVPLFSGFMYAAVASYMIQAWRILDLELVAYPSYRLSLPLCLLIYLNFFTHHLILDLRWALIAAVFLLFRRTIIRFTATGPRRAMPLVLAFVLIGFFVWLAENLSTFGGAWVYPDQREGWKVVGWGKFSSWFLLVIVSFVIVADLKHVKALTGRLRPPA